MMKHNPAIKVLLVDDHEVVRAGYRRLLESTGNISIVSEATDGEQAYVDYFKYQPDVLVMDLSMPGMGGLEASRRILLKEKAAKILVFSVHENEIYLNRALQHGILGYISKRSASQVMIEAVQRVAQGKLYIGQEMMPFLVNRNLQPESQQMATLSTREFEVFKLLAQSQSVNEIAGILKISPKTVGHHATSLKKKLAVSDLAGLTRLAIRLGVVDP